MRTDPHRAQRGLTLLEVITVVAIIAAVVASRPELLCR